MSLLCSNLSKIVCHKPVADVPCVFSTDSFMKPAGEFQSQMPNRSFTAAFAALTNMQFFSSDILGHVFLFYVFQLFILLSCMQTHISGLVTFYQGIWFTFVIVVDRCSFFFSLCYACTDEIRSDVTTLFLHCKCFQYF